MSKSTTLKNPFVGLRAFEEDEDYLFFGRSTPINDLLKRISASRFISVIGSSGSGKSSLVKAGLLPAIYSGFLSVGCNWRVALIRPGNDPIGNLSHELAMDGVLYEETSTSEIPYQSIIESTLRRSGGGLVQAYKQAHLSSNENLLVVVDQFEELFRFSKYEKDANKGKSDALNFINLLLTASQQRDFPIYIILTMRSDFLGDCSQFRGLPEAINEGQYLVPRHTREEIREGITGPVAVGGAQIAPRLLTRLLNDVTSFSDPLPMLQHAMMRTWDYWQKKNTPTVPIDIEDYDQIGGMRSALSMHANEAYSELNDKQKDICKSMFKALTDRVRGIRLPTSVGDLADLTHSSAKEIIDIVEVFRVQGRTFLMPPPNVQINEKSVIDISHESLMRVWDKLILWMEDEAKSISEYLELSKAAKRNQDGIASLWRNPELKIGLIWYEKNKPTVKWAERFDNNYTNAINFLLKSKEEARKEALKKWLKLLLLALLFIGAVFVGGMLFYKEAFTPDRIKVVFTSLSKDFENSNFSDSINKKDTSLWIAYVQVPLQKNDTIINNSPTADPIPNPVDSPKIVTPVPMPNPPATITVYVPVKETVIETVETNYLSKEMALQEYLRRIKKNNLSDSLILAYSYHLEKLRKDVAQADNPENINQSNSELYACLFEVFKKSKRSEIQDDYKNDIYKDSKNTIRGDQIVPETSLEKNYFVSISPNNKDLLLNSPSTPIRSVAMPDKSEIICVSTDKKEQVFVTTKSNKIFVYWKEDNDLQLSTEILLYRNPATAVFYNETDYNIYFGLGNGNFGFVKLSNQKNGVNKEIKLFNESVGEAITSIQPFEKDGRKYLLVTGLNGTAIVYFMPSAPSTVNKLFGNKLSEHLISIKNGKYIQNKKLVYLLTSSGKVMQWNPFEDDLKRKLEKSINTNSESFKELRDSKPIKIYK